MRLYINSRNQIRTGIYNIKIMKYLDVILSNHYDIFRNLFTKTYSTAVYNMSFIHIDETAEAYLDMNTNDEYYDFKIDMTLDLLKDIVSTNVKLIDAIHLRDEKTKNERTLKPMKMLVEASSLLKSALRVWNDEYDDNDLNAVGSMPDPFALQRKLQPLLKTREKIYRDNSSYITTEAHDKLIRIVKQIASFYGAYDEELCSFRF